MIVQNTYTSGHLFQISIDKFQIQRPAPRPAEVYMVPERKVRFRQNRIWKLE